MAFNYGAPPGAYGAPLPSYGVPGMDAPPPIAQQFNIPGVDHTAPVIRLGVDQRAPPAADRERERGGRDGRGGNTEPLGSNSRRAGLGADSGSRNIDATPKPFDTGKPAATSQWRCPPRHIWFEYPPENDRCGSPHDTDIDSKREILRGTSSWTPQHSSS